MKRNIRIGEGYAPSKHTLNQLNIRYISLLAVLTTMCLYARAQRPESSGAVLSGIVTDTSGAAIAGATIMIKGTATRDMTNNSGQFTLRAPKSTGTLTVSPIGHQTIEEKFDSERRAEFNFTL